MHYVKQFKINGVDTIQVSCIELKGKPNTATKGAVGLLGIDMSSPLHEIYKCVAVNGSIYTWELFSSGMSIVSATVSGGGEESVQFPYDNLKTPLTYIVKIGDLILDREGYLYCIESLGATYCGATYCGTRVVAYGMSAYDLAVEEGFEGTLADWLATLKGEPGDTFETLECGTYVGTGTFGEDNPNSLTFGFVPKVVYVRRVMTEEISHSLGTSSVNKTTIYDEDGNHFLWIRGMSYGASRSSKSDGLVVSVSCSLSDKTFSWWTSAELNADYQLNEYLGGDYEYKSTFCYFAIG